MAVPIHLINHQLYLGLTLPKTITLQCHFGGEEGKRYQIHGEPLSGFNPFTDLEEDKGEVQYLLAIKVKFLAVVTISCCLCLRYLDLSLDYFSRAATSLLSIFGGATIIQGRLLIEGVVYLRKYGNWVLNIQTKHIKVTCKEFAHLISQQ